MSTKKRNRQVLVCNNCHTKKRKCDRNLPCSSCVKLSIDMTCSYTTPSYKRQHFHGQQAPEAFVEDKGHASIPNTLVDHKIEHLNNKIKDLEASVTMAMLHNNQGSNSPDKALEYTSSENNSSYFDGTADKQEITKLNGSTGNIHNIGVNPISSNEHIINFMDVFNKRSDSDLRAPSTPYGPLRFLILSRNDPGPYLLWTYLISPTSKKFSFENIFRKINVPSNLEQKSRTFYGANYIKRIEKNHSQSDVCDLKNSISGFGLSRGINFFSGDLQGNNVLSDKIKEIMPDRKTISLLINHFFETLFPFFPILDESAFRSDVSRLTGVNVVEDVEEDVKKLEIENKQDLAHVAILLIVMRLSYISLFSNIVKKNEEFLKSDDETLSSQNKKFLLLHPIPVEMVNIAELCIKEFDIIFEPSLSLFQSLSFMQIYRTYAPEEDSFMKYESTVNIGILYQMANTLFLNRDPDYVLFFVDRKVCEKMKLLKRRLWYFLVNADIEDSVVYGTPIYTIQSNYDTKKPFLPQNTEKLNAGFEKELIMAFDEIYPIISFIHIILERLFKVRSDIKISSLAQFVSDFEILVQKIFGNLNSFLVPEYHGPEFMKVQNFKLYLYCKIMLSYIYYCFYLYYEGTQDIQFSLFYLKKSYAIIFFELAGVSGDFLHESDTYFGSAFTLITSPTIQVFARMRLLLCQILIRLRSTSVSIENNKFSQFNNELKISEYHQTLQNIIGIYRELENATFELMHILSNRYIYSWKSKMSCIYGSTVTSENDLYVINEQCTIEASFKFSLNEIKAFEKFLKSHANMKKPSKYAFPSILQRIHYDDERIFEDFPEDEEVLINDNQVGKLWLSFDLLKQESHDRATRSMLIKSGVKENTSLTPDARSISSLHVEGYHENDIFGNFSIEDFFFDIN